VGTIQADARTEWWGTLAFGEVAVGVALPAGAPATWPAGTQLRLAATAPEREEPPLPGSAALVPTAGGERAYRLLAASLRAEGVTAVLRVDGRPAGRLRALGPALLVEPAGAAPAAAPTPTGEELRLARALLRTLPRAIPPAAAPAPDPLRAPAAVLDIAAWRDRRGA
jgi:hypothetical protein